MTQSAAETRPPDARHRPPSDVPFVLAMIIMGGLYVGLILAMLAADARYLAPGNDFSSLKSRPLEGVRAIAANTFAPLRTPQIRYALKLSLISSSITAILSIYIAIPLGYFLSRFRFPLRGLVDVVLDIPIVLPPLVIGLSLLILFQTPVGQAVERWIPMTYAVPGVILAQFSVSCAFAVRTMRATFDQMSPRTEQVAMTLGCSRFAAFWRVTLPEARRGIMTAGTLAWARALGEFGPVLIFSGTTRFRTEVLPTTVFLELSVGNISAAVGVSMLMVLAAVLVLLVVRLAGSQTLLPGSVRP